MLYIFWRQTNIVNTLPTWVMWLDCCIYRKTFGTSQSSNTTQCRIYASVNWINIGSGNGLSPIRCQAITWTNAALMSIWPLGTNFSEIWIKTQNVSFSKCTWKCRLQNGGHVVQEEIGECCIYRHTFYRYPANKKRSLKVVFRLTENKFPSNVFGTFWKRYTISSQ